MEILLLANLIISVCILVATLNKHRIRISRNPANLFPTAYSGKVDFYDKTDLVRYIGLVVKECVRDDLNKDECEIAQDSILQLVDSLADIDERIESKNRYSDTIASSMLKNIDLGDNNE